MVRLILPLRTLLTRMTVTILFCLLTVVPLIGLASPSPLAIMLDSWSPYYQPAVAVVAPGTPIRWINPTASPHSIRHDGCVSSGPCAFNSGTVAPDSSYLLAELPVGHYPYHCELHPVMRGVLIIDVSSPLE
jgi:hypothetical protein